MPQPWEKLLKFFNYNLQLPTPTTMASSPDHLVLLLYMMALLLGPCLFIVLYSITYTITAVLQYIVSDNSSTNNSPIIELGPGTLVSCPDGLCYLSLFQKALHNRIINNIEHFPSIYALSTIPATYRKRAAKGTFELIGDNVAHYEPDLHGESAWEIVDKLTLPLHLIGSFKYSKISSKPPQGYEYAELFNPLHRTQAIAMLGYCPRLQDLLLVNPEYRLDTKGFLWDTGDNTCKIVLYWADNTSKIWDEISTKAEHHPNNKVTS